MLKHAEGSEMVAVAMPKVVSLVGRGEVTIAITDAQSINIKKAGHRVARGGRGGRGVTPQKGCEGRRSPQGDMNEAGSHEEEKG